MPFYHNISNPFPEQDKGFPITAIDSPLPLPCDAPKDPDMECQICGDTMLNPPLIPLNTTHSPPTPPASPPSSPPPFSAARLVILHQEIPYKLPCSHVFGSRCIVRWLQISHRQDCPHCRRRMVHKGCGHLIMPHHAATAPPTISEEMTPRDCVRCRGESEVAKIVARERVLLDARERALRGSRGGFLPRFWGGINLGRGEVMSERDADVERRVEELRNGFVGVHERAWREYEERERRYRW